MYRGRILPGVSIHRLTVAGLTKQEADTRLQAMVKDVLAQDIAFRTADETFLLPHVDRFLTYKTEQAVTDAMRIGHDGPLLTQWMETFRLLLHAKNLPLTALLDDEAVSTALTTSCHQKS